MFNKVDRVVVTGGTGFLGKAVGRQLMGNGYNVKSINSKNYDLRSYQETKNLFSGLQPQAIIHLAATVGGIGANKENPGRFIYENLVMGTNLIELSRQHNIQKFIMVGTVCSYPKFTPVPLGEPHSSNYPYAYAKRMADIQIRAYREQYGVEYISVIPTNIYGPNDNFDPKSSHVIPALILKFHEAMTTSNGTQDFPHKDVEVWGTGKASREFLYVDDCARAIVMALEKHNDPEPINLGTNSEITIEALVNLIASKMGYQGNIIFDHSKPDGQPRRCLDTTKAKDAFGFEATTTFSDGLERTIEWFKRTQ